MDRIFLRRWRFFPPRPTKVILTILLLLCTWGIAFAWLFVQPTIDQTRVRGIFARNNPNDAYRWTSSAVTIPFRPRTGPTALTLTLAAGGWQGRMLPTANIEAANWPKISLPVVEPTRQFRLLLPAGADHITLNARPDRAPVGDTRFLGVRLFRIQAQAFGWPLKQIVLATSAALAVLLVAMGLGWCASQGYGLIALVSLLGFGLRLYALDHLPTGFFQDEAVAAVDALSLLQTGHDHLGHFLPLGAFEAFGDWVSPLLTYTMLPSVGLLGITPLSARLPAAIAGGLAVPAIYAVAREVRLPRWAALVAALVVAVSPWQILRSRVASPPALVPLCWALALWAGLRFVRLRGRREALWLALAGGLGLYSYPTMKLAIPVLVGLAILAGLIVEAQQQPLPIIAFFKKILLRWWPAALLIMLLWLPFGTLTLFNQNSGMRASRKILQADGVFDWTSQWIDGYTTYFQPDFYYTSGDPANGSDQGVQLPIEIPLVLIGSAVLVLGVAGIGLKKPMRRFQYALLLEACLIAPLPASLMSPNPHLTRALIFAPMYALMVGLGAAGVLWLWRLIPRRAHRFWRPIRLVGRGVLVVMASAILLIGVERFQEYQTNFPRLTAQKYQDGAFETFTKVSQLALNYNEVWVEDTMPFPYIYVLATGGVPLYEAQATIVVDRPGTTFNTVYQVGKYHFVSFKTIPTDLPTLAATTNSLGQPGYLIQELQQQGKQILLLRRMR